MSKERGCNTPGKNNLFRKSNARTNVLRHENGCIKLSSQLQGEHCKSSSDFFPSECTVYLWHRPGHSLGKKSDEHLQCSPQSWLDLDGFMQLFSWRSSLVRALDFLNKLFLPGVTSGLEACVNSRSVLLFWTDSKYIFCTIMVSKANFKINGAWLNLIKRHYQP